jgi:hypothetical protein
VLLTGWDTEFRDEVRQGSCWDPSACPDAHGLQDSRLEEFVQLAAADSKGSSRFDWGEQDR